MKADVKEMIAGIFEKDIKDEFGLVTKGLLDSLMLVQLIIQIEKKFNISILAEDLRAENFDSIDAIVAMIKKYRVAK